MKRGTVKTLLGGAIVAGFSLGAWAEVKENPYQVIIDRNPFALRPIPIVEPPKAPEPPPAPPPEIKLTGITTLSGPPRAFIEYTDSQTKKKEVPSPLGENDTDAAGKLTVLAIDVENQTVKVKYADTEMLLDFEKNGVKPATAAPGAPVPHPGFAGVPNPAAPGAPALGASGPTVGASARGAIVSGATGGITAGGPTSYANGGVPSAAGLGTIPARPVRDTGAAILGGYGSTATATPTPTVAQPTMTRDEAEARIEAQKRILQQQNNPTAAFLPPTRLSAPPPPPVPGK